MINKNIDTGNDYIAKFEQNGQKIVDECRKQLQKSNISIWENDNDDKNEEKDESAESAKSDNSNKNTSIEKKRYTHLSNPANKAYTNFVKSENNYISSKASGDDSSGTNSTLLNTGRIVETMETIEDAGKKHLSFLNEAAPESGNISGSLNGYHEGGSGGNFTIFLGSVENRWQNKKKNIYTKFNATFGVNNVTNSESQEKQNKIVGNIIFDGRLDKNKFIYGAGVEYNSYSNNTQILDIHAAGKHKQTGIGADLTRRTTFTKDDSTGEIAIVSNMKLKLDIVSNKTDNQDEEDKNDSSSSSNFSFETGSSALPSEVEEVDNNAKELVSEYIKPDRKNGSDLDFEYTENKCGITYEYNYNFIDKKDKFLSVTPVIGLHNYTDQTLNNNNESFQMTGGIITEFGKTTSNGQTFKGSFTAMTDRIVKRGSHPFDSHYLLANAQYSNTKAKFNAEIDAGALKSGDITVQYLNLNAEKEMKNSSISLCAGIAKYKIEDDNSNIYNVMATYKYNIPYKTKK